MKNECTKYAESIRDDLNKLFDGETVEECESLIDYLCENSLVEKAKQFLKDIKDITPFI